MQNILRNIFLEDAVCFNTVRNMLGYTGTYKGEKISVMGGGMGVPSVGIYTYELYHEYEVEEIIRIGSAGAFRTKWIFGMWSLLQVPVQIRIMPHSIIFREHLHRLQTMNYWKAP